MRVVTSSEHAETADFDRHIAAQVARPNMVVVGVDPVHRHTAVHFGRETGIAQAQFRAIEQAGNSSFREGNWRKGVEAILASAKGAVGTGVVTTERGVTHEEGRSAFGFGLVTILVVLAGIGLVGAFIARRVRGGAGYGGYQQPPYPPGYGGGQPGYGPGYGGGGGIGSSLLSAGLGGLAGYELGKMAGEREHERDRDVVNTGDVGGSAENFDEGGAAGGWDDAGGGDGGGDFGGGDFGGGDGGGGGSDW